MDKQRLIELGLDEAAAVSVMEDISNTVGKLEQELQDKERQYAVNRIIDKYDFVSDFARKSAEQELCSQNFKLEDGVLNGGGEFMEAFVKDNAYLINKPIVPTLQLMTGGSSSSKNGSVEDEFYGRNPNLRKG